MPSKSKVEKIKLKIKMKLKLKLKLKFFQKAWLCEKPNHFSIYLIINSKALMTLSSSVYQCMLKYIVATYICVFDE